MIGKLCTAVIATCLCAANAAAQMAEYSARYSAHYKGRNVGESVLALERGAAAGEYVFSSTLQTKGLMRLIAPNPVVDRSEFRLVGDAIVPLRFVHEDGSRKGEDNRTITFDWNDASATINGEEFSREVPLHDGVLDRGSLHVALVRALRNGEAPAATYSVLDEDAIDEYTYTLEGSGSIETPIGDLETVRYRQQRTGSSRYTFIDLAPSLDFVPARIEQIRDGESHTAFQLESIEQP